ncbi:MAG: hypothetical protein IT447_16660 [Phycisphaerales bacterium]|nr:hypothetical protein [Phycisphaerales bacterium]
MSASYLVDLGGTSNLNYVGGTSIAPANGVGSTPASGVIIGQPVDLLFANTFCNLLVVGGVSQSGSFQVAVQTSDSTASGSFTDPTSGMPSAAFPTSFLSGGISIVNSGASVSGSPFNSGINWAAGFQRPGRYARAVILSGNLTNAPVWVGFVSQMKVTGSGAGFTWSPANSGTNTITV